jgi:RNA polymerase sigma factor (sigma-70 family)
MADSRSGNVLWHLHHWLGSTSTAAEDGRLLERFVQERDEEAFAALVARYGPLVFGLCRRLLSNVQDAEDVFQATFLVLACKAARVRKPESLSCWLHGVAYRLALKARAEANKRRIQERQIAPLADSVEVDLSWREVRGLLDEELRRLPEKQRLPLVLCYLEGLTQDEAARRLGWSRGTLKRRLESGRERLRIRLTHRGVTLGASLFAAALTESTTKGAVSTALRIATVRAGMQFLTHETTALAATPAVLLAKGALQTMFMTKLKIASVVLLLLACAGFGASQLVQRHSTPQTAAADKEADRPKQPADKAKTVDEVQAELQRMRGTWATKTTVNSFKNGEPQPLREITVKFIIDKDKILWLGEDGLIFEDFTMRLDPSQKPKAIDLISRKIGTLPGIYRLDGDSLKIHYDNISKRPSEFPAEANLQLNLKRVSRVPEVALARFPNAPGCFWMFEPNGAPSSCATVGIVFFYEKDRDGAAIITLAAALPGREPPDYRPVLLDAKGERYLPTNTTGKTYSGRRSKDGDVITTLSRWRMDPKVLPADKVEHLGIEALTPEYHRITARTALERARKESVEVLSCPEIGKPFDFVLTTIEGKKIRSQDLRGKVVLIDCWTTTCSPCRALFPELKELYEKSRKDGLEIIGVSFDPDVERMRKTCVKDGLPWPQVFVPSDEKTRQLWEEITGIGGVPRLFLIDRQGVLRADDPAKLKDEIARLLKDNTK